LITLPPSKDKHRVGNRDEGKEETRERDGVGKADLKKK
jgi:hypothetical protein